MKLSLMVVDIVPVDNKDKAYIFFSVKDGYFIVYYLVSTCQKKVRWTLLVSYFIPNQKK